MSMYFDAASRGFFDSSIHQEIPKGAVTITAAQYQSLMEGQAAGRRIAPNDKGRPVLVDPQTPTAEMLEQLRGRMVVSRFQARAALHIAGLLADAEAAVIKAEPLVQMAWADTVEWRRDSPTIAAIGAALRLTPEQIDDLFRQAATITA